MLDRLLPALLLVAVGCSSQSSDLGGSLVVDGPDSGGMIGEVESSSAQDAQAPLKSFVPHTPVVGQRPNPISNDVDEIDVAAIQPLALTQGIQPRRLPPVSGVVYTARYLPGFTNLLEFTLNNTGSGWVERFLLQLPDVQPTTPTPLLVVFHQYSTSHGDVLNTDFLDEARARGWYVCSPLGARGKHFGNLESQINTRAALNVVRELFPIDATRIYGVGFSMGGGAVTNFASRQLDPTNTMFAAICDHTGSVSLPHVWANEADDNDQDDNLPTVGQNLEVPDVLENLFGGTPAQVPFAYQRCSSIDLDPVTGQIDPSTNMARNLAHVPTLVWQAANDPMAYLVHETQSLYVHALGLPIPVQINMVPAAVHAWNTLDEATVCDWFAQQSLQLPMEASTLADEDGRWFHFQVEQEQAGQFTPFTWKIDTALREIEISETRNLRRLILNAPAVGLALAGTVKVRLSAADSQADRFQLTGVTNAPLMVLRDGVPARGASWTYDAQARTLELRETNVAPHQWTLLFP